MENNKGLANLLLIGLVAFFIYQSMNKQPANTPTTNPAVPVVAPASAEAKTAVAALAGHPKQAGVLAAFYRDFASVLETSDAVKTTGQFQSAHVNGLKVLIASGATETGAPPIGAQVDAFLATATGLNDTALEPAKKTALIAKMRDLSAALGEIK